MRKALSLVLALVMFVGVTACSTTDIEKYKQYKGDMLVIEYIPGGPVSEEEYEMAHKKIRVTYSGDACIPNPVNEYCARMKDEDYRKVLEFCLKNMENNKFKDYSEEVDDGSIYIFTAYDENGKEFKLYEGSIYNNQDLKDIVSTISYYQVD